MQGPIENSLMLVATANAYLNGRRVSGFWPASQTFRFMKICEFRTPTESGQGEFPLVASDPEAWFASLKPWCKGLRLHEMERPLEPNQTPGIPARKLVGFVGGGPRWIIEAVGDARSELWEGFHRLGDRNDADRKIWLCTYILQGEVDPNTSDPDAFEPSRDRLAKALPEIETYARAEGHTNFADVFAMASETLRRNVPADNPYIADFERHTGAAVAQLAVLDAVMLSWVFGGMGSWNDIGGGDRYEALSEELFSALTSATCGIANSTYRG